MNVARHGGYEGGLLTLSNPICSNPILSNKSVNDQFTPDPSGIMFVEFEISAGYG